MAAPDSTAVRVALWRAMHVESDPPPHVIDDVIGLQLVAPPADWRSRGDMHPIGTKPFRASIVARGRLVEDLVLDSGVGQYVILGAGLDTFAQRRSGPVVFEVDRPEPQAWKRQRLIELGYDIPRFVPVDFEAGETWWDRLIAAGFDATQPAVVASTGVSMYLTKEAIAATLRQVAALAPGSVLVMSFLLPIELADADVRPGLQRSIDGARAQRHAVHQFLHSRRNAGARARGRIPRRAARLRRRTCGALLCRKDGRSPPAEQRGRASGRDHVTARNSPANLVVWRPG